MSCRFQIEKNVDPLPAQGSHQLRALAREKLQAHLEKSEPALQPPHQCKRIDSAVDIESKNQFVGHRRPGFTHGQ